MGIVMVSKSKKISISLRATKGNKTQDGERCATGFSEEEVLEKCKKLYNKGTSVWIGVIAQAEATGGAPLYGSYTKTDIESAGVFDTVLRDKFVHHVI